MSDEETPSGPKRGGPEACPRPCTECHPGHHFSDAMIEFAPSDEADAEDERDGLAAIHPAEAAGCLAWYVCKHCDAWQEWTDDADLDDDLGPEEHDYDEEAPGRYSTEEP